MEGSPGRSAVVVIERRRGNIYCPKCVSQGPYNCCFCLYCSIVLQPQLQVRVEQVRLLPPEDGAGRRRRRRGQGMGLLQSVLLGGEPQHAAERHSIRNVKRDLQKVRDMDCLIPGKIPYGQSFAGTALIPCRARSSAPWGRCTRLTQCISGKEDMEEKFLSTGITFSVPQRGRRVQGRAPKEVHLLRVPRHLHRGFRGTAVHSHIQAWGEGGTWRKLQFASELSHLWRDLWK